MDKIVDSDDEYNEFIQYIDIKEFFNKDTDLNVYNRYNIILLPVSDVTDTSFEVKLQWAWLTPGQLMVRYYYIFHKMYLPQKPE